MDKDILISLRLIKSRVDSEGGKNKADKIILHVLSI